MCKKIFCRKICILGAESTGTTTMAKALAKHYRTNWVPEYGREYYESKMYRKDANDWKTKEFIEIAREQYRKENMLLKTANKVLICDTDPFTTGIWHERYMGFKTRKLEKIYKRKRYDLYLLTDANIPFVQDGTRDGKNIRKLMHKLFIKRLTERNKRFEILSGSHENRLAKAITLVNSVLKSNNQS